MHCLPLSIKLMKPGAMLINVSRGGLVESDALFDALESGQLGALGLDVYDQEGGWRRAVEGVGNGCRRALKQITVLAPAHMQLVPVELM